jgi:CBS domain containing-hemolysin-like protein
VNLLDIFWKILATLGLVGLNGFFVAAEFAAVGARRSFLQKQADAGNFVARVALGIKRRLDLYLSTCQLGITIASLALGYVTEPAVAALLEPGLAWLGFEAPPGSHHWLAITIALAISTSLHVVVGEVAPKNLAIFYPDRLLPVLTLPLVAFTIVFYPVIWVLNSASNVLLKLSGVPIEEASHGTVPHSVEELRALLEEAMEAGSIETGSAEVLTGAFDFGDLKARQVMTPRVQVDFLLTEMPMEQILRTAQTGEHTRLPLCEKDLDHVIGMIHLRDLFGQLKLVVGRLRFTDEKTDSGEIVALAGAPGSEVHVIGSGTVDLTKIRRDILFVPELLPVHKLLRQMQESSMHMAVVVDEYGGTVGVVTLEDIIEQIVGDITDEFDITEKGIERDGESFRVGGHFPLHELRDHLDINGFEPPEDVDTLGGYVAAKLARWPRAGDYAPMGDYIVRVTTVTPDRRMTLLITPIAPPAAHEPTTETA